MIKKVLLILLGLFVLYYAYGEYQIQTKGMGVWIDRQKALGTVTNQYGIRDEDLKLIDSREYTKTNRELFIQVAKDTQDIILNSNNKDWILKNGRAIWIREMCLTVIEYKFESDRKKNISPKFVDTSERSTLYQEYYYNYNDLGLEQSFPPEKEINRTNDELRQYCFNLKIQESYD